MLQQLVVNFVYLLFGVDQVVYSGVIKDILLEQEWWDWSKAIKLL